MLLLRVALALGGLVGLASVALFAVKAWRTAARRRLEVRRASYLDLIGELALRGESPPKAFRLRAGDPVFRSVLLEYLRFLRGTERRSLLEAARRTGVVDHYLAELRSLRKQTRVLAASALAELADPDSAEDLLFGLGDPVPEVRVQAAAALARIGDPRAVRPLLATLEHEEEWNAARIADLLTAFGSLAVGDLTRHLSGPGRYRALVTRILGLIGDVSAEEALVRALSDRDREVRIQATSALGRAGGPGSVPALCDALASPDWQVRAQAANALGTRMDGRAVPWLRRALRDESWWVRHNSAAVLAEIPRGTEALRSALDDSDRYARDAAAAVLLASGSARRAVGKLDSDDPLEREDAFQLLEKLAESGKDEYLRSIGFPLVMPDGDPGAGPDGSPLAAPTRPRSIRALLAELDRHEGMDAGRVVDALVGAGEAAIPELCRYLLLSGPFLEAGSASLPVAAAALASLLSSHPGALDHVRRALAGQPELWELVERGLRP